MNKLMLTIKIEQHTFSYMLFTFSYLCVESDHDDY